VLNANNEERVVKATKIPRRGFRDGLTEGGWYAGARIKREARARAKRPREMMRIRNDSRGVKVS
jgi:hypothetical protein